MKKIIAVIFILISFSGYSQTIDKAIKDLVKIEVQSHIGNSDTITIFTTTKKGNVNFDTIAIANNSARHYQYTLTGFSPTSKLRACGDYWVSNTNGIYSIDGSANISIAGLGTGASFGVVKSGNILILQLKLPTTNTTLYNWELRKSL